MAGLSLDHPYIDDHHVAERFVKGELPQKERESFERHYVDCAECMDRVALAQIFHVEETALPKPQKHPMGLFNFLGTFAPRQQALIFVAATLVLLLMPVAAVNWLDSRTPKALPETEAVVWLPQSGPGEVRIPSTADHVTIAAPFPEEPGTYRISIVDVTDRTLVGGPDQSQARGLALGLRLPAVPAGVVFAVVEKKAENGAYSMVSRHPLLIAWH